LAKQRRSLISNEQKLIATDTHNLKQSETMNKKKKIKANDFLDLLHDMLGDRHEHIGDDWKPKKPKTTKKP